MKRLLVVLATLLLAAPAFSAVLIDFDGFNLGDMGPYPTSTNGGAGDPTFDSPLALLGVSISGNADTYRIEVITGETGELPPFSGNYLAINTIDADPGNPSIVTVDFQRRGASWFAQGDTITLDLWDTNETPAARVVVTAYDDLGNVAEVVNFTPASGDIGTVALSTTSLISRIEILDNGGDGYNLDNLGFELQHTGVPEPGSIALVGAGLLAVSFLRRRR